MDNLELKGDGVYDLDCGLREHPQQFTMSDVAKIHNFWTDNSDEPSFVWLIELGDGRWVTASGGHDYTGWDCQSGLGSEIWSSREEAIRWGFTKNDRENLGLQLPEEKE